MKNSNINFRHSLLMAVLLLGISSSIQAQKFEIGARLMPSFSTFDIKNSTGGTVKGSVTMGFGAGAMAGFNISNNVGIEADLIYNTISQKYKNENVEQKITLSYVSIPLLLSLNTNKTKRVNFNMVLGPQLGINVGSNLKTSGNDGTSNAQAVLAVKKNDLGVAYGAGVDIGINAAKSFRLGVGYRGAMGLIDVSDNSKSNTTNSYYVLDRTHIKTNAAYIGISYLFL